MPTTKPLPRKKRVLNRGFLYSRSKDDVKNPEVTLLDIDSAEILVVSQFTLSADTSRGNRPGVSSAATPEIGEGLYEKFVIDLQKLGIKCKKGVFGGDMQVSLINDGPTTIWIDSNSS